MMRALLLKAARFERKWIAAKKIKRNLLLQFQILSVTLRPICEAAVWTCSQGMLRHYLHKHILYLWLST